MNVKQLKKRADKAWTRRSTYDAMLRDVYDFVMPYRDVSGLSTSGRQAQAEGARRTDRIFDATAPRAAFNFAGRLQRQLTPLFQSFFSLEAGPLAPGDDDEKKKLTEIFQRIGQVISGVLASGEFHNNSHEGYLDLYAGTMAMLVLEGDDIDIARTIVVPIAEIALEEGPYGKVWGTFWKRKRCVEHLKVLWPEGKFGQPLQLLIDNPDQADTEVEITQYTYFNPDTKIWKLAVWSDRCNPDDAPIWTENFRTNPWITPRLFKVPGEVYGRGPANLAMPFVKTLNKAQELLLHAGQFALSGLWMYRNDGVFNPDTAKFEPRAMWAVSSTGGPMGPAIQRLDVPKDFDISQLIIEDQRAHAKLALFDDRLPPEAGAVRSATEIAERLAQLSQDLAGAYGRLTLEIVVPLVQRLIDILESRKMLDTNLRIDQLLAQVRVTAPIAVGQMAEKIKSHVDAIQMSIMLGGPELAQLVFKMDDLIVEIARWMGVEEKFLNSSEDRKNVQAQRQQMAAAQQASEVAKNMSGMVGKANGAAPQFAGAM